MILRLVAILAALLLLPAPPLKAQTPPPAAAQASPLVVEVQLVQGTAGGPPPTPGQTVQLLLMAGHDPLQVDLTARTDASGLARITVDRKLLGEHAVRALAVAEIGGIRFYSEPIVLGSASESPLRSTLTFYQPLADAAPLKVVSQTLVVLGQRSDSLAMHEVMTVRNPTDRVIVAESQDSPLLTEPLPHNVRFLPQRSTAGVVYDPAGRRVQLFGPFMPGDTRIILNYDLLADRWPVELRKPLGGAGPENLRVAVATRAIQLRGPLGASHVDRDLLPLPVLVYDVRSDALGGSGELVVTISRYVPRTLPTWSYAVTAAVAVLALGLVLFRRSDQLLAEPKE